MSAPVDLAALLETMTTNFATMNSDLNSKFTEINSALSGINSRLDILESKSRPSTPQKAPKEESKDQESNVPESKVAEPKDLEVTAPVPTVPQTPAPTVPQTPASSVEITLAEHSPQDHSKSDRRSTMLFGKAEPPIATVIRTQKPYDYISLEKLHIASVVTFCQEIDKYRRQQNADIQYPASLINDSVINDLVARNFPNLTLDSVMLLPYNKLGEYLMKACQPYSADLFQHNLETYVHFDLPKNFMPSVSSYYKFRDALLKYREQFLYYYTIMSQHNQSKNIPRLNARSDGLIAIFLARIPFEYGKRLKKEIEEIEFDSFDKFLDKFFKLAQTDAKTIEKAKVVLMRFKVAYSSRAMPNSNLVQSIEDIPLAYDDIFAEETLKKRADNDSDDELDFDNEENFDDLLQQLSGHPSAKAKDFSRPKDSKPVKSKSAVRGCAQKLFRGTCNRLPKCSKEHDTKSLQEACQHYLKILQNSPYNTHRVNAVLSRPPAVEITDDQNNPSDY